MVATDIREQRLRIQLRPAAGGDLGIVEETRSTQPRRNGDEVSLGPKAEAAAEVARGTAAARGRPSSLRIVWACVRHAASVRYQRVTLDDLSAAAGVSERRVRDAFSDCHGMSPTAFLRVAALLEVRRVLLEAPLDPRRRDTCRIGLRLLAPRSVCGTVPSAVRRGTEHHARTRKSKRRIGIAWSTRDRRSSGPTDVMSPTASSDDDSPHPTPATIARAGVAVGRAP